MYLKTDRKYYQNTKISVAMFVANTVIIDSRVIKTAQTLKKLGYSVTVFGFDKVEEKTNLLIYEFPICILPNPVFKMRKMVGWNGSKNIDWDLYTKIGAEYLSAELNFSSIKILHTHDMVGLAIGGKLLESQKLREIKWIHDIHEYVEGCTHIAENIRIYFGKEEQRFIKKPDILTTVSPAISDILSEKYKLKSKPIVVLNAPRCSDFDKHSLTDIRSNLGLSENEKIITYVGNVKEERGVETIIEAMAIIPNGHLVILTNSKNNHVEYLKSRIRKLKLQKRVTFLPYVPFNCVTSTLRSASIGIHPFTKFGNSDVALPNKLFEYLHAGIPVISSDVKSMQEFIKNNDCGMSFKWGNSNDLADKINKVSQRLDLNKNWKKDISDLSKNYSWEVQEEKLDYAYFELKKLLNINPTVINNKKNNLRILHLPLSSAGQPGSLANGLKKLGNYSQSLTKKVHRFKYKSDINLEDYYSNSDLMNRLISIWQNFDILHYHALPLIWSKGFTFPSGIDILLAKLSGKKVFYQFRGRELRFKSIFTKVNKYHNFNDYKEGESFPELQQVSFSEYIFSICDGVFVVDPELQTYIPNSIVVPRVIDIGSLPKSNLHLNTNTNIRIVHAPSSRGHKGTKEINMAIRQIKNLGINIDYRLVENLNIEQALEEYKNADIVIDQLRFGWYGVLAVEAMSLGKPVISYVRHDLRHHLPFPFPLAIANPENIKDVLLELTLDKDLRLKIGERAKNFVEEIHDVNKVCDQLQYLYQESSLKLNENKISNFIFSSYGNLLLQNKINKNKITPKLSKAKKSLFKKIKILLKKIKVRRSKTKTFLLKTKKSLLKK